MKTTTKTNATTTYTLRSTSGTLSRTAKTLYAAIDVAHVMREQLEGICGVEIEDGEGHHVLTADVGDDDIGILEAGPRLRRRIRRLGEQAAVAGDLAQVAICDRALRGDQRALVECIRVLSDAEAQS